MCEGVSEAWGREVNSYNRDTFKCHDGVYRVKWDKREEVKRLRMLGELPIWVESQRIQKN